MRSWRVAAAWVVAVLVGATAASCGGPGGPGGDTTSGSDPEISELRDGCLDSVADLPPPAASTFDGDLGELVATGRVPAPPPFTGQPLVVVDTVELPDVDAYFEEFGRTIAPVERRAAMERYGYRGGRTTDLAVGGVEFTVITLRFASPAAAVQYRDVHLRRVCAEANRLTPVPGVPGAVSYVRVQDDAKTPKVVMVIGDTEVSLAYCGCPSTFDPVDSVIGWSQLIGPTVEAVATEGAPA